MNDLLHLYEYNYEMPDLSGIYAIVNNINGKKYIGQSKYLPSRAILLNHSHNSILQKAYDKYGINNFSVLLLEVCEEGILDKREIYWIQELHTWIGDEECKGYNLTPGGRGFTGVSEEERLSRSRRMLWNTINLGRKASEETRAKLRAAAPREHSVSHNKRVSESLRSRGIRPSEEALAKSAETNKVRLKGNTQLLGRKFINDGKITKAVPEGEVEEFLQSGWILGRVERRRD